MTDISKLELRALLEREHNVAGAVKWLVLAAAIIAVLIGFKAYFSDKHQYALLLAGFAALMIINLIVLEKSENYKLFQSGFLVTLGLLYTYLILTGGENNTGILWLYVLPPFIFFIAGIAPSLIVIVLLYALVVLAFFFPELPFVTASYGYEFKVRFSASMLFVTIFAYYLERQRRMDRANLIDVSVRHEALRLAKAEVEREKAEAEANIVRQEKAQAEAATEAKSRFLAHMSHEIRTPLNAVIGYSELLLLSDLSAEEGANARETVHRCSKHLLNVVNDILDLSRIEAGQLNVEPSPVELLELMADVRNTFEMAGRRKGLTFEVNLELPLPRQIHTDATRLRQILFNLLSNASKFTPSGSITLAISCKQTEPELCFKITDTGIGMTAEQCQKLFAPFVQADASVHQRFGGSGLGLYICKELSAALGGSISVESQKGVGSTFTFTVYPGSLDAVEWVRDKHRAGELMRIPSIQISAPNLHGSVLYAEDNEDNRRFVSYLLSRTGISLDLAENGQHAVEMALAGDYDLILMDVQMPAMSGTEATSLLRQAGFMKPIIMLTANVDTESLKQCVACGATDTFSKPIHTQRFFALLREHLPGGDGFPSVPAFEAVPDDLRESFRNGLQHYLDQLGRLVQAADWSGVRELAHQLKGAGGSYGFSALSAEAGSLETVLSSDSAAETERAARVQSLSKIMLEAISPDAVNESRRDS